MEIIPYFDDSNSIVVDGDIFKALSWCRTHFGEKCTKYYKSINNEGFCICPCGFTSYKKTIGQVSIIYTSIVVSGHIDRKQIKQRLKNESAGYKFSEKHFLELVEKSIAYNNIMFSHVDKEKCMSQKIQEITTDFANYKNYVYNTLHDIRNLNRTLYAKSEDVLTIVKKYLASDSENDYFKNDIHSIFAISGMLTTCLATLDILVNSSVELNKSITKSLGVYNKVFKCKQILSTYYRDRHTNIHFNLSGESFSYAKMNDLFEICLYLILENYQKYSPENTNVNINFMEDDHYINIIIENEGPKHTETEINQIFDLGFRNPKIKNKPGNGIGLYIVKTIFDYLGYDIKAESEKRTTHVIDGIEYSIFRLKIKIPIDKKMNSGENII